MPPKVEVFRKSQKIKSVDLAILYTIQGVPKFILDIPLWHKIMYDIDRYGKKKFEKIQALGKPTRKKFYKDFTRQLLRTNNRRGWWRWEVCGETG